MGNVKTGVNLGANSNSNRTNVGYRDIDPECREQRSVICLVWWKENGRHKISSDLVSTARSRSGFGEIAISLQRSVCLSGHQRQDNCNQNIERSAVH